MADTKLTALSAFTPVRTDLLYGVDDPGGTPASGKLTIADALGLATAADVAVVDSGGLLAATDVEAALAEIATTADGNASSIAAIEADYLTSTTTPVYVFDAGGNASATRPSVSSAVVLWVNSPSKPTNMTGNDVWLGATDTFIVAVSDETTALTTGTAKRTFRMPAAFTLTGIRASVTTAPTGAALTVDVNEGGTTILSTKLTIDATEKTSTTAATPAVISDSVLADDAEITIDIDTVGSSVAGAGLKVTFIGYWTT